LKKDEALKNISDFDPLPLKKMLESMGYSFFTKEINSNLYETYIFKLTEKQEKKKITTTNGKVPIVLQSATPVTYPIIIKMLESEQIKNKF